MLGGVVYQGASPAGIALLGGVIDSTMANLGEAMTFQQGNSWRILVEMAINGFGMKVDVYSPSVPAEDIVEAQCRTVGSLIELAQRVRAGGSTEEALARTAEAVAAQVVDVSSGRKPAHLVDTDVWERRRFHLEAL